MEKRTLIVLLIGLMIRIGIAPFTGHSFDFGLWTYSARLFYESGFFDVRDFPTLPILYYVQLGFYSFYALLRLAGFHDVQFLYHSSYVVESLFLKLPMILSDVGVFFLFLRFTKNLKYAALFYLNPFIIYLTASWGTYDSLMMLPLVAGFVFLATNKGKISSMLFAISGLVKLLGFVPFVLLAAQNLIQKRFREVIFQVVTGIGITAVVFAPLIAESGLQSFVTGLFLQFFNLSGAMDFPYYNISAILPGNFTVGHAYTVCAILGLFTLSVWERKKEQQQHSKNSSQMLSSLVLWTLVGSVALDLFSRSEPQWLSWVIPLSILYAFFTNREGLASYSYFYGTIVTFLVMTLTQTSTFLPTGVFIVFLRGLEGIHNSIQLYNVMIVGILAILLGHVFMKPRSLKIDTVILTVFLYVTSYFLFVIMQL